MSVNESANLLGITKRAIQKKIKDGQFVTREVTGRGGKRYEIALSSLPVEAQARYWEVKIKDERLKIKDEKDSSLRCAPFRMTVSAKALARHDLLSAYAKYCAGFGRGKIKQAKETFLKLYNEKRYFDQVYNILGPVSYATIERWRKQWEAGGKIPDALEDRYKSPSQSSISAEQSAILISHILSPNKPPLKEAIRLAKEEMRLKGIAFAQSDITFYRYGRKWIAENLPIYTFTRYGGKKLNDELAPFVMRDYSKIEVGDIFVADGHVLNFEIINPFTGKTKRMQLIVFYDMKCGLPMGFEIMPTENTMAISGALRRSILLMGKLLGEDKGFIPRAVYIDNGRAFRGQYFTGVHDFEQTGLKGLYERLGIKTIIAKAYHGQSKTVERFFGAFGEFERRLTTYIGNNIENKPARLLRNEKAHVNAYKALTGGQAPELAAVYHYLYEWILEYAQRPHQDGYFKGYSPLQVFEESAKKLKALPDYESRLIDFEKLHFLMMEERRTTIQRNGIRFNNRFYWNEALYGRREAVVIKYDWMYPEKILVFEPTGEFICEATLPERVHPAAAILGTEADKALLRRQLEAQARLKKETAQVGEVLLNAGVGDKIKDERLKIKDERGKIKEDGQTVIGQLVAAAEKEKEAEPEEPIFVWEFERKAWEEERLKMKDERLKTKKKVI
ncbi:Mu transposase C-terminal domain-containing protein [Caldithrix abyssi]|uniref:Mu transposase C-terminal domain-containing protein n=1 Tax=Caldithrix abyssi TaxID=187145 RepID=UPI001CED7CD6|nr:Mu transposase C-terminal domain-containing protein [Caldithrix abyssi]